MDLFCDGNERCIEIGSRELRLVSVAAATPANLTALTLCRAPRKATLMQSVSLGGHPPRFLVADVHAMFGDALRVYLERTYTVVGVVQEGRALVEEALRLRPDVIIVDVALPVLNGLDAAKKIKGKMPQVKLIFLTIRDDPNVAAAALELGEVGFVLKDSTGQELLKAIDQVLHGKSYLSPKLRTNDWKELQRRVRRYAMEMTPRQREVLQLVAEGWQLKEIAGLLDLSAKTIEFHKQRMRQSFHLKNNSDFVLFALKRGLISQ